MLYRYILLIIFCIFATNCTTTFDKNKTKKTIVNGFANKGFALVYTEDLFKQKIVNKKIDERSLIIFQKNLKINSMVKITNILNNKSIIGNNLNEVKNDKKKNANIRFSYTIKIADFYFNDSALLMLNKIKTDSQIINPKIKKISTKKYRVYLGPYSNINSLQKSYNDISILKFDNIEIIKND